MPHYAIIGMTESGKSSLARKLAETMKDAGTGILILDPLSSPEWEELKEGENGENVFITSSPEKFLDVYWNSNNCAAFFDEAGDYATNHNKDMIKTATKGRHYGHSNFYIAQRGNLLARTIRDQCSEIFMFTSSLSDAKLYAEEFNESELLNVPELPQGSYYRTGRYKKASRHLLFKGKTK